MDVVERFFADECNEYVRERLLGAIERRDQASFTFNVFNVHLNFPTDEAVIEDELDPTIEATISIPAFEARLRASSA